MTSWRSHSSSVVEGLLLDEVLEQKGIIRVQLLLRLLFRATRCIEKVDWVLSETVDRFVVLLMAKLKLTWENCHPVILMSFYDIHWKLLIKDIILLVAFCIAVARRLRVLQAPCSRLENYIFTPKSNSLLEGSRTTSQGVFLSWVAPWMIHVVRVVWSERFDQAIRPLLLLTHRGWCQDWQARELKTAKLTPLEFLLDLHLELLELHLHPIIHIPILHVLLSEEAGLLFPLLRLPFLLHYCSQSLVLRISFICRSPNVTDLSVFKVAFAYTWLCCYTHVPFLLLLIWICALYHECLIVVGHRELF